ncbi:MAG: uracil-DNA glycosylase family protein [Pseudomonadota bacterium]
MSKLPFLPDDIAQCRLCADLPRGPLPIVQLSPKARILIASQAPGRIAHESGVPFQDPSGRRLRRWLGLNEAAFYDAEKIAILPMGFCYPGKAGGGDAPPKPLCAKTWRTQAISYLKSASILLIIGRHALGWHAPAKKAQPLTRLAKEQPFARSCDTIEGPFTNLQSTFILPHPSPRNTQWLKTNPWFEGEIVPALQNKIAETLALVLCITLSDVLRFVL